MEKITRTFNYSSVTIINISTGEVLENYVTNKPITKSEVMKKFIKAKEEFPAVDIKIEKFSEQREMSVSDFIANSIITTPKIKLTEETK